MATTYTVSDVGALPLGNSMQVSGINSSGAVIGTISLPSSSLGFTWSASSGYTYLAPLSSYTASYAEGVNDRGQVVGYSYSSANGYRACLWESGKPVEDLGVLGSGGTQHSFAFAINSAGQVVGRSDTDNGYSHAFLWSPTTGMQDLNGATSPDYARPWGIDDYGTVVGQRGLHAFVWTASAGMTDLGFTPTHIPNIIAYDVNNSGQILCNPLSTSGQGEASIWQNGKQVVEAIGLLPDMGTAPASVGSDINNLGQIAGTADHYRPFIWNATDGIQALSLPTGFAWQYASAINDAGVIAGYGRDSAGISHLLLWTPVPEPSSLLALLAGLGGFGSLLRRRSR